jgi:acyl-CoA synthetase (AMP-forming)/AMP-acid ligase II
MRANRVRDTRSLDNQFREWLVGTVWPDARQQGVSRATFDRAVAAVTLNWSQPDLQRPGRAAPRDAQHQAEFQSPVRYCPESQVAANGAPTVTTPRSLSSIGHWHPAPARRDGRDRVYGDGDRISVIRRRAGIWQHTSDAGLLREHSALVFLGREDHQIKTGGESVYPFEIMSVTDRRRVDQ